MRQLTKDGAEQFRRDLRRLAARNTRVRIEWERASGGETPPGVGDFATKDLSVSILNIRTAMFVNLVVKGVNLRFPARVDDFVPRTSDVFVVYYEVVGNEVSFEFRGFTATHKRSIVFS